MKFEEFKNWLCSMSKPVIHRAEWSRFKDFHANPDKLGSEEDILEIDDERYIIRKIDRFPPDYDLEEFELHFDDHILSETKYRTVNSFSEIVEPYLKKEFPELLDKWRSNVAFAYQSTSNYEYYKKFPGYQQALKLLLAELRHIRSKGLDLDADQGEIGANNIPHNYSGDLTDQCIQDLKKYRDAKPLLAINKFFESAHTIYPSCRHAIKEVDGKRVKNKISWHTLRYKIKESHPGIYYRKK